MRSLFSFFVSLGLLSGLGNRAGALTVDEQIAQADALYDQRDYDAAGINRVQQSADIYESLMGQVADPKKKASLQIAKAQSMYFLGQASSDSRYKITIHDAAYKLANEVAILFGVTDVKRPDLARLQALPVADKKLLAEGLYQRGINLGQWGQASGVTTALFKWSELRENMKLIVSLGFESMSHYGPLRTLGRGFQKVPVLMGGDMSLAEQYLKKALNSTLALGKNFSVHGTNNVFYAEFLLDKGGRKQEIIDLLTPFVAADPVTLLPGYAVENRKAQEEAKAILASL